jgi:ribonuclease P protein component
VNRYDLQVGARIGGAEPLDPRTPGANREAHLPAEHPPPCPQARVPCPDAHTSRSFDHQGPPAQGAGPAVGLIGRITERRAFERLNRHGRRAQTAALWCRYLDDQAVVPPQVAFAIGRSVGSAVARNRIRRRLRELVRAASIADPPRLARGQLLIGAKPGAGERSFDELGRQMSELLRAAGGTT